MQYPNAMELTSPEEEPVDLAAYKERADLGVGAGGTEERGLFPLEPMALLHQRLRAQCASESGLVVAAIAPHARAGVTSLVHGLGRGAAALAGQRVLVCDATASGDLLKLTRVVMRNSLVKLAAFEGFKLPAGLAACGLDYDLTSPVAGVPRYAAALQKFRSQFDLIVLDLPNANESQLGPALARHADATVVVVEARRTRAPMARSLISTLSANGAQVSGVVLNKRVRTIPNFIYRWL